MTKKENVKFKGNKIDILLLLVDQLKICKVILEELSSENETWIIFRLVIIFKYFEKKIKFGNIYL